MKRGVLLGGLGVVVAAGSAAAFTQKTIVTSIGHEYLIVQGAQRAGGEFAEPGRIPITGETASCRSCETYDTHNWKTWSAVMGNRFTDIGGYWILGFGGSPSQNSCFLEAIQNSEWIQYQHALRKKTDVGPEGLVRAHGGTVAVIRDRFYRAVTARDESMWFRDGGVTVLRFKANRPAFLLGMAIHALQDSFTTEHVVRSADWHEILDMKTYVKTPHALRHADPYCEEDRGKFHWYASLLHKPFPNEKEGDYPFKTEFSNAFSNLKESAVAAVHATTDLVKAFEAARLAPQRWGTIFAEFEAKWLRLGQSAARTPAALQYNDTAHCNDPVTDTENIRLACLRQAGIEDALHPTGAVAQVVGDYPKFCWPESSCKEDAVGNVRDAITRATHAAGKALTDIGSFFSHVAEAVEDFFNHATHTKERCIGESADFGRRGGDHYMNAAHDRAETFWAELGDAIDMLSLDDRKRAVDAQWATVKSGILSQEPGTRDRACSRVRGWFFRSSSKDEGERTCRSNFDAHVGGLGAALDQVYDLHIHRGISATGQPSSTAPAVPHFQQRVEVAQQHHKNERDACKARPAALRLHHEREVDPCEQRYQARLHILDAGQAPPPHETPDQKRDRLYEELMACMQSPLVRAHNVGATAKHCRDVYDREMREANLKPRSAADDVVGNGLHNGSVVKGSGPAIYLIDGQRRHLVPDMATLDAMGIPRQVKTVGDAQLNAVPLGEPLPREHAGPARDRL